MTTLIIVSPEHKDARPLVYNLGETTLIITSDYTSPDAFELAAPVMGDRLLEDAPQNPTIILDPDETYNLYQCLHELFHPSSKESSD